MVVVEAGPGLCLSPSATLRTQRGEICRRQRPRRLWAVAPSGKERDLINSNKRRDLINSNKRRDLINSNKRRDLINSNKQWNLFNSKQRQWWR